MDKKEYIEREEAVRAAKDVADEWDGGCSRYRDAAIESAMNAIPAADLVERKPAKTNADKYFRNATDRQIADFIHEVGRDMACPPCICPQYKDCSKCWLEWLKQEVESDG